MADVEEELGIGKVGRFEVRIQAQRTVGRFPIGEEQALQEHVESVAAIRFRHKLNHYLQILIHASVLGRIKDMPFRHHVARRKGQDIPA